MSQEEPLILQEISEDCKFRVFTNVNPLDKGKPYITKVLRTGTSDIQSLFEAKYSSKHEAIEGHRIVLFVLNTKMFHLLHKIAFDEERASREERRHVHNENNWHTGGV